IINSATGVLQGCNYGAAAKLPMKYTNAVVMGTNLSGTIVSIFMLASLALSPTPRAVGIVYFALALVVIVVCLISQFFLKNNNFYIYYTEKDGKSEASGESHDMSDQPVEGPDITGLVLYKHVFDWYYIWGVIFMSLSFGYLSSLGMMYAPRFVHSKHKSTAGMMSGLALIIGIFVGVNSSLLHPILIQT
ncbi:unnamed protein product, partial [Oppiella nova]